MWLGVSTDEFQKKLDAVYNGKPGVIGITDDIIIIGNSEEEHSHNFWNFLQIKKQQPETEWKEAPVQTQGGIVLWIQMVKGGTRLRSKEDEANSPDTDARGQGNHEKLPVPGYAQSAMQGLQQVIRCICTIEKDQWWPKSANSTILKQKPSYSTVCGCMPFIFTTVLAAF